MPAFQHQMSGAVAVHLRDKRFLHHLAEQGIEWAAEGGREVGERAEEGVEWGIRVANEAARETGERVTEVTNWEISQEAIALAQEVDREIGERAREAAVWAENGLETAAALAREVDRELNERGQEVISWEVSQEAIAFAQEADRELKERGTEAAQAVEDGLEWAAAAAAEVDREVGERANEALALAEKAAEDLKKMGERDFDENMEALGESANQVVGVVVEVTNDAGQKVVDTAVAAGNAVAETAMVAAEVIDDTAGKVVEVAEDTREHADNVADIVTEVVVDTIDAIGEAVNDVVDWTAEQLEAATNWLSQAFLDSIDVMGDMCNWICQVGSELTFDKAATEKFCKSSICKPNQECAKYATEVATTTAQDMIKDGATCVNGFIREATACTTRPIDQFGKNVFDPEATLNSCLEWGECTVTGYLQKPLMCGALDVVDDLNSMTMGIASAFGMEDVGGLLTSVLYEPAREAAADFVCAAATVVHEAVAAHT